MSRDYYFWLIFPPTFSFLLAYFVSAWFFLVGVANLCHTVYRSIKISTKNRGVLVTGCDTGFGHQVAINLHAIDFTVFACCLDDQSEGARRLKTLGAGTGRLHVIKMDVTNQKQVDDARRFVESHLPELGLWGILNNAGLGNVGFAEWLSMEEYKKQAEVNLFGAVRVTKAFIPMIRKNQGRIVNVSSIMARIASPYSAAYCITKHGIGVYTDVLRMEMKRFNVTVCTIEPGNYLAATKLAGKDGPYIPINNLWDELSPEVQKDYGKESLDRQLFYSIDVFMKLARKDVTPVVTAMTNALSKRYPKDRYFEASLPDLAVAYFYQFAPSFLSDKLVLFMSQK